MENHNHRNDPLWEIAQRRAGFKKHFVIYLLVNLFLWGLWFFNDGHEGFPWPVWPTFGWGIGIVAHFFSAYGNFNMFSAEKEYEKLKSKNK